MEPVFIIVLREVIGLLMAKGQSMVGTDQDDVVIMPIRAFQWTGSR